MVYNFGELNRDKGENLGGKCRHGLDEKFCKYCTELEGENRKKPE